MRSRHTTRRTDGSPTPPGPDRATQHPPPIALPSFCSRIAHALRNPLSGVLMNAQMLAEEIPQDSPFQAYLADILDGTRLMEETLQLLVDFTTRPTPQPRSVCLREATTRILQWIGRQPGGDIVRVRAACTRDIHPVHADPDHTRTILIQLVRNAVEAMPRGGDLLLSCRNLSPWPRPDGERLGVEVEILDTGTGILEEDLPNVFEPFFTTRPKKIGLGLSMVSLLCGINHGNVLLESRPGEGTRARVQLPAAPMTPSQAPRTPDAFEHGD